MNSRRTKEAACRRISSMQSTGGCAHVSLKFDQLNFSGIRKCREVGDSENRAGPGATRLKTLLSSVSSRSRPRDPRVDHAYAPRWCLRCRGKRSQRVQLLYPETWAAGAVSPSVFWVVWFWVVGVVLDGVLYLYQGQGGFLVMGEKRRPAKRSRDCLVIAHSPSHKHLCLSAAFCIAFSSSSCQIPQVRALRESTALPRVFFGRL